MDTRDESSPMITLLTGPNYSGKSVDLKQIALIVYMAHVGSFVPASQATIGFVDKIMGRIQTRESVSRVEQIHIDTDIETCIYIFLCCIEERKCLSD